MVRLWDTLWPRPWGDSSGSLSPPSEQEMTQQRGLAAHTWEDSSRPRSWGPPGPDRAGSSLPGSGTGTGSVLEQRGPEPEVGRGPPARPPHSCP